MAKKVTQNYASEDIIKFEEHCWHSVVVNRMILVSESLEREREKLGGSERN